MSPEAQIGGFGNSSAKHHHAACMIHMFPASRGVNMENERIFVNREARLSTGRTGRTGGCAECGGRQAASWRESPIGCRSVGGARRLSVRGSPLACLHERVRPRAVEVEPRRPQSARFSSHRQSDPRTSCSSCSHISRADAIAAALSIHVEKVRRAPSSPGRSLRPAKRFA